MNDSLDPPDRFRIEDTGDALEILIPVKKDWGRINLLLVWLVGWAAGETAGIRKLTSGEAGDETTFLWFWLAFWTVGGLFAAATWFWHVAGYERIRFRYDSVLVRREAFGIGISHEYDAGRVSKLRLADDFHKGPEAVRQIGSKQFKVAFDFEQTSVRFGYHLDRGEASRLILKIQKRFGFTKT